MSAALYRRVVIAVRAPVARRVCVAAPVSMRRSFAAETTGDGDASTLATPRASSRAAAPHSELYERAGPGNGWPAPRPPMSDDSTVVTTDADAPFGRRMVNVRGHPATAVYFNGLLRSQHVIASLRQKGPQTVEQLWLNVQNVSGIESKRKMKHHIDRLTAEGRLRAVPPTGKNTSYVYHALSHPKNIFDIPDNFVEVSPDEGEQLPPVPRGQAPDPFTTPRWPSAFRD